MTSGAMSDRGNHHGAVVCAPAWRVVAHWALLVGVLNLALVLAVAFCAAVIVLTGITGPGAPIAWFVGCLAWCWRQPWSMIHSPLTRWSDARAVPYMLCGIVVQIMVDRHAPWLGDGLFVVGNFIVISYVVPRSDYPHARARRRRSWRSE